MWLVKTRAQIKDNYMLISKQMTYCPPQGLGACSTLTAQCKVHSAQCSLHSAQCNLHSATTKLCWHWCSLPTNVFPAPCIRSSSAFPAKLCTLGHFLVSLVEHCSMNSPQCVRVSILNCTRAKFSIGFFDDMNVALAPGATSTQSKM